MAGQQLAQQSGISNGASTELKPEPRNLASAEAHHSHRQHERAHAHPKAVAPGLAELEVVAPDSVKQAGASRSQVQEAQAALPEASTFTSAAQALAADNKTVT
ncbi:TPA: hypothetical protein ACH3X3_010880 [Trebouxia sp. C0006]